MQAKNMMGGLLVGAALGVAAGLLLAPRSGEKTRNKLMKGSLKLKNNAMRYIDDSIEGLRDQLNEKIDQLAKRGKDTINHVSERVKV